MAKTLRYIVLDTVTKEITDKIKVYPITYYIGSMYEFYLPKKITNGISKIIIQLTENKNKNFKIEVLIDVLIIQCYFLLIKYLKVEMILTF